MEADMEELMDGHMDEHDMVGQNIVEHGMKEEDMRHTKHWNLFIIVPQQNTGFILDSDMEGKNEDSYKFTNVVQKAFGNMKWNLVECNQQRHYWKCGYYVMKWMRQFVTHQQHSLPKTVHLNVYLMASMSKKRKSN
ncbi:ulp1 protease family, C-terminal catalytic domain-containing protein [Tanacetum coccineum]|uniref:Ulp1 protease family, C-terminal catalytic domain-containing protein n=1 Tax=Tanacetum coccineum TaxID=301880 RepID=A0ABQ5GTY2_9ASTR